MRTHLAAYDDTTEVQDNASRVGINFRTRGAVKMFAGAEWGVNLVRSETQFNLSASGDGEFGVVDTETNPLFTARLGSIGIDFGPAGRIAMGKQTAVHYDVTSYTTDRFNVFGGQGTSTYVAGTDGGETGTGFADRVVELPQHVVQDPRNRHPGPIPWRQRFRGCGCLSAADGAARRQVWRRLHAHQLVRRNQEPGAEPERDAEYAAVGTRIDLRVFELGLVYSHQENGDMVQVPFGDIVTPVAFDADGLELHLHGRMKRLGLIGGFTYQNPDIDDPLIDPDFNVKYAILGGEWFVARTAKIYTESKIDLDSVSPTGEAGAASSRSVAVTTSRGASATSSGAGRCSITSQMARAGPTSFRQSG